MSDDVTTQPGEDSLEGVDERVHRFWEVASAHARLNAVPAYFGPNVLDSVPPPAWSFGDGAEQADELLAFGSDVYVEGPPALRDEVVARLRAGAEASR